MEPVKVPIHQVYCALTMAKEHCLRLNWTSGSYKNVINVDTPFKTRETTAEFQVMFAWFISSLSLHDTSFAYREAIVLRNLIRYSIVVYIFDLECANICYKLGFLKTHELNQTRLQDCNC